MNILSKVEPGKLLHIICRGNEATDGRKDLVSPDEFIQVAAIRHSPGHTFRPHHHIWNKAEGLKITQESWVIISGVVEVTFYDLDNSVIHIDTLRAGDCSITLQGGHNYKFLEEGFVYEFKTGPYEGQEKDKVMI